VSPKLMVVVLAVVTAVMAALFAPAAQADWPATTCVDSSTPIGNSSFAGGGTAHVTLSVGGVVQDNVTQTYIAEVCRDANSGLYNFMVGPKNGATIDESGNTGPSSYKNGADAIVLSFTLNSGDVPKSVEAYGNISAFAISGQTVTITGTPGALTQINYGGPSPYGACMGNPYSGTYGAGSSCAAIPCYDAVAHTADSSCVDDLATFHGAVRGPNGGVDKTGMWITSAANLYSVGLNNCASSRRHGNLGSRRRVTARQDNGANRPAANISVQMVGPHYKTDGTLNYGNIHAFIPFAVIQSCFGTDSASFAQAAGVTRQEGGTDTSLVSGTQFTLAPTTGGLLLTVPTIGFSSPTYTLTGPRASSSASTATGSTSARGTITGVKWMSSKGKVTSTFTQGSTVKAYKISAKLAGKTKTGSCAAKGTKVTCAVKGLTKGKWAATITSTLKTGGAGPSATKTVSVK